MVKVPKQVTINQLPSLSHEEIKEIEGKCLVLINTKVPPKIGLKLSDMIQEKNVTMGEFFRYILKQFVENGFSQGGKTDKSTEIPEYYTTLDKIFGEILKTSEGKKILFTVLKKLGITTKQIQEMQKNV